MRGTVRKGVLGLPLLELAIAVCVSAGVVGAVAWRADALLEQAEAAALKVSLAELRAALRLEKARRLIQGESMTSLIGSNPFVLMTNGPESVTEVTNHGLVNLYNSTKLMKSHWRFEPTTGTLSYMPQRVRHLEIDPPDSPPVLLWRIDATGEAGKEVELVGLTAYRWF